jgi:UDP-GlcNAc:undecaprenyl-phosphate/decaprenyl-phosphate GlcNAc-1-phosphate transferase
VSSVLAFVIALAVAMSLMPPLMRLATRWGLVDLPAARKVHSVAIPRIGGVAMAAGLLLAVMLAIPMDSFSLAFLASAGTLLVFGVLDDRFDLDYRLKFIGQLLAIGIIIWGGGLQVGSLTLGDRVALPAWVALPLTGIFLLGITNAINLADGLDGLAGGTSFLCLGAIGLLARSEGLVTQAVLALGTAGAVLGFLRYNTFPARVFMGDAGSQLLGFAVGVLGVAVTQDASNVYSTSLPVLLAGIPVLDTLSVMTQRLSEGRSMFVADRNHLHHKLLALGFDQRESVTLIYVAQIVLFVAAYLLRFDSDLVIFGVYLGFCALVIGGVHWAQRSGWRLRGGSRGNPQGPLSRFVERVAQPRVLLAWSAWVLGGGLLGYAVVVLAQASSPGPDFRYLALALMCAGFVSLALLRARPLWTAEKAGLYVLAAMLVYMDPGLDPARRWIPQLDWILPLLLALVTALRLRLATDRRFELTPLDLLVLFVALAVPSLPGLLELPPGAPLGIAKIVVLFYAIEMLEGVGGRVPLALRLGAPVLLAVLCLRPGA